MSDTGTLTYGLRHAPETIQAVAAAIEAGNDYATIAKNLGISERSIDRIVAENSDLALLRAHARHTEARQRVAEGLALIDAPLPSDPKLASAEATRAKNRADFRKWLAGCLDRETYGEKVSVDGKLALAIIAAFPDLTPKPLASVAVDPALPPAPKVGETQYDAP